MSHFVVTSHSPQWAHPAAWQSQSRGRRGMACSAAFGTALASPFHPLRAVRGAVDN